MDGLIGQTPPDPGGCDTSPGGGRQVKQTDHLLPVTTLGLGVGGFLREQHMFVLHVCVCVCIWGGREAQR